MSPPPALRAFWIPAVASLAVGLSCSKSDETAVPVTTGPYYTDSGADAHTGDASGGKSGAAGQDASHEGGGLGGGAGKDASVDTAASGGGGSSGSSGGTGGSTKDGSAEAAVGPEKCDGLDNDGNGSVDEGCDDDGDGFCDSTMSVTGSPAVCPKGKNDCSDTDPTIFPGSTTHKEAVDYDCDGKKEYLAEIIISVDDELTALCANGEDIAPFGPNYGQWPYSDTYQVVLESGKNAIGVSGKDTGTVISAFIATIKVNGQVYRTDGVPPPPNGLPYTAADPEWTQTKWRYFPKEVGTIEMSWCDRAFDDSTWGPAILAQSTNCPADPALGELGHCPWNYVNCGDPQNRCPSEFAPYYDDGVANNEPRWVWDYYPVNLNNAWFRHRIDLP